jgi:hypothetical protein
MPKIFSEIVKWKKIMEASGEVEHGIAHTKTAKFDAMTQQIFG